MNKLPDNVAKALVTLLHEGTGIRATARILGISKETVTAYAKRLRNGTVDGIASTDSVVDSARRVEAAERHVRESDDRAVAALDALLLALSTVREALVEYAAVVGDHKKVRESTQQMPRIGLSRPITDEQRRRMTDRAARVTSEITAWRARAEELERTGQLERAILRPDKRLVSFDKVAKDGSLFDLLERLVPTFEVHLGATPEDLLIEAQEAQEAQNGSGTSVWRKDGALTPEHALGLLYKVIPNERIAGISVCEKRTLLNAATRET